MGRWGGSKMEESARGRRERDNDDQTSTGQNRAIGWI